MTSEQRTAALELQSALGKCVRLLVGAKALPPEDPGRDAQIRDVAKELRRLRNEWRAITDAEPIKPDLGDEPLSGRGRDLLRRIRAAQKKDGK